MVKLRYNQKVLYNKIHFFTYMSSTHCNNEIKYKINMHVILFTKETINLDQT